MRRRTSTWWRWAVGLVFVGLGWRWCRSDESIETTIHVKLAAGVTAEWVAELEDILFKTDRRCVLTPARVRALLVETGSPQTDGPYGPATQHIGPRPDVTRAIARARELPGCNE